ncbi:hypothetical protein [Pseudomonas moraviensis]|uniref:hypothetical protein n=1 Tax=Pseudomonas moraviensis TaxID=321662 RepID=UPI00105A7321|nr:hypothetical protein [Pseudomonas moraviensis]TDK53618.1 hypothetical protein E1508_18770 [Pseudomonas moraviensis]
MNTAIPFVFILTPDTIAANQDSEDTKPRAKRGPKPKILANPHAHLIRMAIASGMSFIDDAVMAGVYIGVSSSNGKLNVRPRHVRKVICLDTISTAEILPRFLNNHCEPITERTAQYLAAAARIAIGGIERHLNKHPLLKRRLQAKWDQHQHYVDDWDFELDSAMHSDGDWHNWDAA